ncbi:MAG: PKD domain-containing protein [Thermoplasmata archaeon]|nr:PKD domain-containing protein [Thermoplasmata archaeon]MCI4356080.1 PKD domain-containing protein [Thermoplasmata archaeon]
MPRTRGWLDLALILGMSGLALGLILSGSLSAPGALGGPFGAGTTVSPRTEQSRTMGASASATPTTGSAPLHVTFQISVTRGSSPYRYSWSFGDSGSSSAATPSHTYTSAGSYTATVKVTDARKATVSTSVRVGVLASGLSGVPASLIEGPVVARTPGTFWSVDAQTSCATCISTSSAVTSYLASSPFTWVRYGQQTDACNISADRSYSANGVASPGCGFDLTALKTWCDSTTPHCHAILSLPGENNNSREDAAIAQWIVHAVGFQPDYWSIGNEPTGWNHYGIAWTHWRSTDHSRASPLAYALDVKGAIAAVSAVDPGAKFIGIEAACSCNTAWFQDVAKVDGPNLAAVAVHNYPSSGASQEKLAQFYGPLAGPDNITNSVAAVRTAIAGECSGCGKLPVFVNEYNAGPGWAPSNFAGTYANAVFLAASVSQALTANVSQLTMFNLESSSTTRLGYALLGYHGAPGPSGTLFSGILRHLAKGTVVASHVATTVPEVWAVATFNATTESILIVNANLTRSVAVSVGLGVLASATATVVHWNSSLAAPVSGLAKLATGYTVPAQGILLVNVPRLFLLGPATMPAPEDGPPVPAAEPARPLGVPPLASTGLVLNVVRPPVVSA